MDEYKKQFVRNMLAYAVQRDIAPGQWCRLSGLDFKMLSTGAGPAITLKQLDDLWRNVVHLSGDAAFGLHFGESLRLSALGAVGQIIQSSRTVGEAITMAAQSIHLITDLFTIDVARNENAITITFLPDAEKAALYPDAMRQMVHLFMVFTIHELDGLVFEKIVPLEVSLPLHASVDGSEYERVFRCMPEDDMGCYRMKFHDRYWEEVIITANHELQSMLIKIASQAAAPRTAEPLLSERIADYLMANAYLGIANLEAIAANFNTSARSLQRRLREEGVSFQQLADSVRRAIAMQYLQSGSHPLKEVSYMLGYNELSAFSRAFKRWTGLTPQDYQKKRTAD
jgi:AraC-like DNA-binding protein